MVTWGFVHSVDVTFPVRVCQAKTVSISSIAYG
jgi:hypothetical protein